MEKSKQYIILEKYFRGEASSEEIEQLKDWFVEEGNPDSLEVTFQNRWQELSDSSLPRATQQRMWNTLRIKMEKSRRIRKNRFCGVKKEDYP